MIASLAVFFAWHVFWPGASAAHLLRAASTGPRSAIAAVALALLVKNRAGVMTVIAGSALAGIALMALRA